MSDFTDIFDGSNMDDLDEIRISSYKKPKNHKHIWAYCYVRGSKRFKYPFPVWMARRYCKKCKRNEILVPNNLDFNIGKAVWIEEIGLIIGRTMYVGMPTK